MISKLRCLLPGILLGVCVTFPVGAQTATENRADAGRPLSASLSAAEAPTAVMASAADVQQGASNGAQIGARSTDPESQLSEVIVTARRRQENLQEVPIAVTVVSQAVLQQNNIVTIGDIQSLVPSMSTTSWTSRDSINVSIRGQGTNGPSTLPGVVAYLDEVPIPTDLEHNLAGGPGFLFDMENVQVLKGPQGTLFGRNSVGGDLLLQTARPTNDFSGHIQATYGNYNDREIDGVINIPIIDNVLLTRFAINGQLRDGFTFIQSEPGHPTGIDADNRDYFSARGTISFIPTQEFQNDTVVSYNVYDSNGSPVILTGVNTSPTGCGGGPCPAPGAFPTLPALFAQQQALGIRTAIPVDDELLSKGSNLLVDNITRYNLTDQFTLRNIFGYDRYYYSIVDDLSGTALPIFDDPSVPRVATFTQLSDELQLLGHSFAHTLDWIVGAFYLDNVRPSYPIVEERTVFGGDSASFYEPGFITKALYGQGTYDWSALLSGLKVTGGVRYTWDQLNEYVGINPTGVSLAPLTPEYSSQKAPTWTMGLNYQVDPKTMLYLTTTRGYRAGGPNNPTPAGTPLPGYSPEYVLNYEFGVKSDWEVANVPIRTNADVYYENYKDIQVEQLAFLQNAFYSIIGNAATARLWGAELESSAQVTRNLQLGLNFDYLGFKYTNFGPGVDSAPLLQSSSGGRPRYKYGLFGSYHLPIAEQAGEMSVRANWTWQDKFLSVPYGVEIQSYGLLNLSADWTNINQTHLDVSLFASNALNKDYVAGGFNEYNALGIIVERFGEPRMYGIRLRYNF